MCKGLKVHEPNAWHLVHCDESSLKRVVKGLVMGVSNGKITNEVESVEKVSMPELVATGDCF